MADNGYCASMIQNMCTSPGTGVSARVLNIASGTGVIPQTCHLTSKEVFIDEDR